MSRGHAVGHHSPIEETLALIALAEAGKISTLAWLEGGNAFGAPGVLGTLDPQTLSIITAGVVRAIFDLAGAIVPPAPDAGSIGTAALPWGLVRALTVITGDLVLVSRDGRAHWVMKEHEGGLYVLDRSRGIVHRLHMERIDDPPEELLPHRFHHAQAHGQARLLSEWEERAEGLLSEAEARSREAATVSTARGAVRLADASVRAYDELASLSADLGRDPTSEGRDAALRCEAMARAAGAAADRASMAARVRLAQEEQATARPV